MGTRSFARLALAQSSSPGTSSAQSSSPGTSSSDNSKSTQATPVKAKSSQSASKIGSASGRRASSQAKIANEKIIHKIIHKKTGTKVRSTRAKRLKKPMSPRVRLM